MTGDTEILVKGGKPWFSWGILAGVAILAGSGVAILFEVKGGQRDVLMQLESTDEKATKAVTAIESMAVDMRAMRNDINDALLDRWTNTDTKFWGLEMDRFWSDFARLNPTQQLPVWPAPKRVTHSDSIDGPRK